MKIIQIIKYLMIFVMLIIVVLSIKNIAHITVEFLAQNFSIRDNIILKNSVNQRGTHSGSLIYNEIRKKNISIITSLNKTQLLKKITSLPNIDYSNVSDQIEILNILLNLSKQNFQERRKSIIFIPRNLSEFWEMSCDTHMTPLIVPAFSSITMYDGLPNLDLKSCYGHILEYGFYKYYKNNKKFKNSLDLNCKDLDTNKHNKIIKITKVNNKINVDYIYC